LDCLEASPTKGDPLALPEKRVSGFILLAELKLIHFGIDGLWLCEKISDLEVCPKCASPSKSVYDHRWVQVRDEPIRGDHVRLKILKRRFYCKPYSRPLTELIPGVLPRRKTTQRFRLPVMEAYEKYTDLSRVKREFKVSYEFMY